MDTLTGLLSGPRAQGAFLLRTVLDPPWSLRIEDEAALTIVALSQGEAWFLRGVDPPVQLLPGDIAIVRGPEHYTIADLPDTPIQVVIHPDQRCTTVDGRDLYDEMHLGMRTWGNNPDGQTRMLTGTYNLDSEVSQRLLHTLPMVMHLRSDQWDTPLVPLLSHEMTKDQQGQDVILDRLLDLLLMSAIRAWFDLPESTPPQWYTADGDPSIRNAIRLLQNDPAYPWTVAKLAGETGMSRASLARRFTELVGEPPMTFLTNWRLTLAADLLCEPGTTVTSVAPRVGYASPYALSAAFKRVRGVSPKEHRLARLG
ncbi:MAG: AraC family transcriptional regulator [Actinomycetia bacterium]|nr:AraC family transcriptional regulator [Actinomycetes bacterium]